MEPSKKLTTKTTLIILTVYFLVILCVGYAMYNYYLHKQEPIFESIGKYEMLLKKEPKNPTAYAKLGDLYYELSEKYPEKNYLEDAMEEYEKAIKYFPENVGYKYNLAVIYEELGVKRETIKQYKEILKIDPQHLLTNFDLATAYMETKDFEKAIKHFKTCLELEPSASNVYYNLGIIYEELNDVKNAKLMFEYTQKYDPNYAQVKQKLEKYNELKTEDD